MILEKDIEYIKEALIRIERHSRPQKTWINATWLMKLTGWNPREMQQARQQGIIEYKRKKTGSFEYLLQSVPEQFIIKKQVA